MKSLPSCSNHHKQSKYIISKLFGAKVWDVHLEEAHWSFPTTGDPRTPPATTATPKLLATSSRARHATGTKMGAPHHCQARQDDNDRPPKHTPLSPLPPCPSLTLSLSHSQEEEGRKEGLEKVEEEGKGRGRRGKWRRRMKSTLHVWERGREGWGVSSTLSYKATAKVVYVRATASQGTHAWSCRSTTNYTSTPPRINHPTTWAQPPLLKSTGLHNKTKAPHTRDQNHKEITERTTRASNIRL